MTRLILAVALAGAAASAPALADSGRIACQRELSDVVAGMDRRARVDLADWIEVVSVQCSSSRGLAQASMETLRDLAGTRGQTAQGLESDATIEWPSVAGLAD